MAGPTDPTSVIEAMARAQYDKYMSGVSDIEPGWSELPESHRERMRESLRAALAAAEALGWKLVPVEPTEEMQRAGYYDADHSFAGVGYLAPEPEAQPRLIYRAMLAASPSIAADETGPA